MLRSEAAHGHDTESLAAPPSHVDLCQGAEWSSTTAAAAATGGFRTRRPITRRRGATNARRAFITAPAATKLGLFRSGGVHRRMPTARGRVRGRGTSWQRRCGIADGVAGKQVEILATDDDGHHWAR